MVEFRWNAEHVTGIMPKKKLSPIERFIALSDEEKAAEVAALEQFDRDHPGPLRGKDLPGRPLNESERKLLTRAKRKVRGRPQIGQGSKLVPVSIERGFLKQVDAFAKAHRLKRSQAIVQGLRLLMRAG